MKKIQVCIIFLITVILLSHVVIGIDIDSQLQKKSYYSVSFDSSYYILKTDEPITILFPRSTIPAILEPTQGLIIQMKSISFDSISATIETSYDALPDRITLPIDMIEEKDQVYLVYATIPKNTPQELYNLTITIDSEETSYSQTRPRAISIKNQIHDSYSYIHVADFHIGDPRGLKENPKETIGWKAARKTVEEINLINPDFVIITGDLTFGQMLPFEYIFEYKKCYEILQTFQVPTFLCPGNHDGYIQTGQDGFKFWEYYFGPLYYSFDYDETHFQSINSYDWPKIARIGFSYLVFNWGGSIREEQLSWIEMDLDEHQNAAQIAMMMHHNPLWDTKSDSLLRNQYQGRQQLLDSIDQYSVDLVFAGHVHYDDVSIQNDTTYITTTTVASSIDSEDGYWGYRLIQIKNTSEIHYNYKEPKYSIPSYRLNQTMESEYSLTIQNDLDQAIPFTKEFIVPNKDYTVNYGSILQKREIDDMVAVYIFGEIDAQSSQTITLS